MNDFSEQMNPAIIVMAKIPQIGTVKTRLRPFLSAENCAELAGCFLQDALSSAAQISENIIFAFSPAELKTEAEAIFAANVKLIEQNGFDLGERLFNAFLDAENLGFSPLIAIGTDSPTLPPSVLQSAIKSFYNLENDLILGATDDGGYYLIGLRKPVKEIFADISWSSAKVFQETVEKANLLGMKSLTELPVWYDVDLPDDLMRLNDEVSKDEYLPKRLPNTAKWLRENAELFEK